MKTGRASFSSVLNISVADTSRFQIVVDPSNSNSSSKDNVL